jgi:hypothetical protein
VIEHEILAETGGSLSAAADSNYLTELGLTERLDVWRDLCKEKLL